MMTNETEPNVEPRQLERGQRLKGFPATGMRKFAHFATVAGIEETRKLEAAERKIQQATEQALIEAERQEFET